MSRTFVVQRNMRALLWAISGAETLDGREVDGHVLKQHVFLRKQHVFPRSGSVQELDQGSRSKGRAASPLLTRAAYVSIAWLLLNWWPHDSLHVHTGMELSGLKEFGMGPIRFEAGRSCGNDAEFAARWRGAQLRC